MGAPVGGVVLEHWDYLLEDSGGGRFIDELQLMVDAYVMGLKPTSSGWNWKIEMSSPAQNKMQVKREEERWASIIRRCWERQPRFGDVRRWKETSVIEWQSIWMRGSHGWITNYPWACRRLAYFTDQITVFEQRDDLQEAASDLCRIHTYYFGANRQRSIALGDVLSKICRKLDAQSWSIR